ncbi:nicotinamide riboside kinase 1 [Tribolium castaneum]|uniref:Nicotinamide riboside kinase 1-like Protein n=1 Tax=Tribolium castaneum TaxID=7070 RepID=D6W6D7_TRICA|nr:PREDICTED: nicotinamide riboside kinase 1 [Tribolium castaneum]EFA11386.1 Nicotinamide riboside kinase 1-like Protein [Tribolium castaneum]|eukprot:XP_970701.1 PREDICTED: nicotinamide riboside kinase 1 [Tribolium castaneum]
MSDKILIIGISGVTCGGKTTLANELNQLLPNSKLVSQDDYFLGVDDPRHVWIPELNHINFDILSSLDMEKMNRDIHEMIKSKEPLGGDTTTRNGFKKIRSLEELKSAVIEKIKGLNLEVLLLEGFSIFNYKPLRGLFHLKYFFTLPKDECFARREQRVYEPPDCPGYFEQCAWPEHLKQKEEVENEVEGVRFFDGRSHKALEEVLGDIDSILEFVKL